MEEGPSGACPGVSRGMSEFSILIKLIENLPFWKNLEEFCKIVRENLTKIFLKFLNGLYAVLAIFLKSNSKINGNPQF